MKAVTEMGVIYFSEVNKSYVFSPKFVITTGDLVAAAQKYGCGACDTANTEPATQCATCKGDKCNVKVETVEFKCPTYAANEAGDKFEEGDERSCFKTKGTHGECNT